MKDSEVIREVESLDPDSPEDAGRLAGKISADSLEAPRTLVTLWAAGDERLSTKAAVVLIELDHLPLLPLLDQAGNPKPKIRATSISLAVDFQLVLRARIVARLQGMFDDTAEVPEPESPVPEEEEPLPRRVCDEAYLQIRRLLKFDEGEIPHALNANEFLTLEDEEKDEEIRRVRESRTFSIWASA